MTKLTRSAQKKDTHERIRQAAWELFTTSGFAETTTKAVAERAGVAAGTVFLHASDKEDLLHMVMHDRLEAVMEERFANVPTGPLIEQLLFVFRGFFAMYAEHPAVAAAFVRGLPGARGPNAQRVGVVTFVFFARIAGLVTAAQERGEVSRQVDPMQCAGNFFALYFMSLAGWISGYHTLEAALDPGLRSAFALQMRGLGP